MKKKIFIISLVIASIALIYLLGLVSFGKKYSESEIKKICEGKPYWCEQNMSEECVDRGICVN